MHILRHGSTIEAAPATAVRTLLLLAAMSLVVWHICTRYFDDPLIGFIFAGIALVTVGAPIIGASAVAGGGARRRQP